VITLDAAQTWTVIAIVGAGFFSVAALIPTMFIRVLKTEIGAVRTELGSEIGSLRTEVRVEISSINRRLDGMDRDIQTLMNREFGTGRA
jgi:hypothetical protein